MSTLTAPLRSLSRAGRGARSAGWPAIASASLLVLLVLMAFAAPLLAPQNPNAVDLGSIYASPSGQHWLGTDALGRDLMSRLIWGARTSLIGPLMVAAAATLLGSAVAIATAWRGGRFDSVTTSLVDTLLGFPGLLLAILSVALFGKGLLAPVVALAIAYMPYFARVTRSAALRERSLPYVTALTVQGMGGLRVSLRHVLPNILPLVLAQSAMLFAYAMIDLAAISFLGMGVQPPTADWGSMVAVGQSGVLQGHPMQSLTAGGLIVVTVVAVSVLAEGIAGRSMRGQR
jgi:peptide/nickel transport system permease protein